MLLIDGNINIGLLLDTKFLLLPLYSDIGAIWVIFNILKKTHKLSEFIKWGAASGLNILC